MGIPGVRLARSALLPGVQGQRRRCETDRHDGRTVGLPARRDGHALDVCDCRLRGVDRPGLALGPGGLLAWAWRQLLWLLRLGRPSPLTPEERALLQPPLYLAPSALAAAVIVQFQLVERYM